jgi:hypothetical protein
LRKKIIAPRGPRSDLCVVVVTTSACSNGEGTRPAATSPEMCAMSARSLEFFFFFFFLRGFYSAVSRERDRGEGTERKREKEREKKREREKERKREREKERKRKIEREREKKRERERKREREGEREEQAGIKEKKGAEKVKKKRTHHAPCLSAICRMRG